LIMFLFKNKRHGIRLFAYDDPKGRGRLLVNSAKRLGVDARLFTDPSVVPDSSEVTAYIHMVEQTGDMEKCVRVAGELVRKRNITMIPRPRECGLFYSKIKQTELYSKWMPRTWIARSKDEALHALQEIELPFISKADQGGRSQNVRLVNDEGSARNEIELAFGGGGIPMADGSAQKGYLYWQEFMPGNDFDWRVAIIAKRYAYLGKRFNREGTPFASGSNVYDAPRELTAEAKEILDFAIDFAKKNDRYMAGMDVVRDKSGKPILLEVHTSWGWKRAGSPMYEYADGTWSVSQFNTKQMYDVIAKAIVEGDFKDK
jgi:glutathione synthase/RimK-type ligase-like ATP-grasp enzyme